MKLKVSNFTRIAEANIEIDGITVIAGQNNTGKSTIGKILFSLFNSINNLDEKIITQVKNDLFNYIFFSLQNILSSNSKKDTLLLDNVSNKNRDIAKKLTEELMNNIDNIQSDDKIQDIIRELFCDNEIVISDEIEEIIDTISEYVGIRFFSSRDLVINEVVSRYFVNTFGNQINSLKQGMNEAEISLCIKEKQNKFLFCNNECEKSSIEYNILHEAFYIDNPFILDELYDDYYNSSYIKNHISRKIMSSKDIMNGIFNAVSAKEKLKEIYKILNQVVEGDIVTVNNEFALSMEDYSEPIKLSNLSIGLKSFVILRMMLEKGCIKDKDVLILDEPEIHLHPEWQMLYAEIIVLLQKLFDLSIVVTAQSADFLDSIEFFSKKHKIDSKCRYYLTSSVNGMSYFEDVTQDTSKIYSQMIQTSVILKMHTYILKNILKESL